MHISLMRLSLITYQKAAIDGITAEAEAIILHVPYLDCLMIYVYGIEWNTANECQNGMWLQHTASKINNLRQDCANSRLMFTSFYIAVFLQLWPPS